MQPIAVQSKLYKCLRNYKVYDTHGANNPFLLLTSRTAKSFELYTTRWMSIHYNAFFKKAVSRMAALEIDLADSESHLSRALGSTEGHARFPADVASPRIQLYPGC